MGNTDSKLDLWMELDRDYYISGQDVHGCVFINAKEHRK